MDRKEHYLGVKKRLDESRRSLARDVVPVVGSLQGSSSPYSSLDSFSPSLSDIEVIE